MNRIKTIAVTVLVAALPFAPAAFASDRGHGDRGHERPGPERSQGYGHNHHGYPEHYYRHYYRHYNRYDHDGHRHGHRGAGPRVGIYLPFPVIVLNTERYNLQVETYPRY